MGRSSAEQALINRSRIVEEASRLFRERGVDAVSVSDIMTAARLTVGGFYKHFASKEALAEEACALSFEQAASAWLKWSQRDESPSGAATIVENYLRKRPAQHTCPMLAYAAHASSTDSAPPTRKTYAAGVDALLSDFLAQTGSDQNPQSHEEAQLMFAAMVGAQLLAQASGHAAWANALKQTVVRRARQA